MERNELKKEEWRPIDGYEGLYEVSNLGRVKSLKYGKERILRPKKCKGYLKVGLCRNGKHKILYIHRLVATAFIPNPEGLEQVNHKDENKSNNCVENIEWCSAWYNMHYGTLYERSAAAHLNHPAKSKPVEASKYEDFSEICLRFPSAREAGRNGYCNQCVSKCCRGCYHYEGNNKYKNLYWRYEK